MRRIITLLATLFATSLAAATTAPVNVTTAIPTVGVACSATLTPANMYMVDVTTGNAIRCTGGVWAPWLPAQAVRFASTFPGADMCAKITAAITNLPSTGGVVDARSFEGSQACVTNPFTGTTKRVTVLLGVATIQMQAQWTVWANSRVIGQGRGQTHLQAVSGFPTTGKAMILLGAVADAAVITGARVEDLWIDCNSVTACEGIESSVAGDGCGGSRLFIEKYKGSATRGGISMLSLSDKYLFDDVELAVASSNTTTRSIYIDPASGPSGVFRRISVRSSNSTMQTVPGIDVGSGGAFYDVNVSDTADGILFQSAARGYAQNVTVGTNVTSAVRIIGSGSITLGNIVKGAATNTVKDDSRSIILTDAVIPSYSTNSGASGGTFYAGNGDGFKISASTTIPGFLNFQRVVAGAVTTTPMSIDANGTLTATKISVATGAQGTRYSSLAANDMTIDGTRVRDIFPDIFTGDVVALYGKGASGLGLPFWRNASNTVYGTQIMHSTSYTVATLPAAAAANVGWILAITDAATANSCTTGGGAKWALCRSNGTAWLGTAQ